MMGNPDIYGNEIPSTLLSTTHSNVRGLLEQPLPTSSHLRDTVQ